MNHLMSMILWLIFIVSILALGVGFIERAAPVVLKADYNRKCDQYTKISIKEGGLTNEQIDELIEEIEGISDRLTINSINITRVGEVPYGDDLIVEVDSTFKQSTVVTTRSREPKTYPFIYYKKFRNNILIE